MGVAPDRNAPPRFPAGAALHQQSVWIGANLNLARFVYLSLAGHVSFVCRFRATETSYVLKFAVNRDFCLEAISNSPGNTQQTSA